MRSSSSWNPSTSPLAVPRASIRTSNLGDQSQRAEQYRGDQYHATQTPVLRNGNSTPRAGSVVGKLVPGNGGAGSLEYLEGSVVRVPVPVHSRVV
eukprot:657136-Rhodomonas_salina.1